MMNELMPRRASAVTEPWSSESWASWSRVGIGASSPAVSCRSAWSGIWSDDRDRSVPAGALGAGFTLWAFSLFPYGDAFAQSHVVFYMAITAIGCVFCLMHMRAAAFLLIAFVLLASLVSRILLERSRRRLGRAGVVLVGLREMARYEFPMLRVEGTDATGATVAALAPGPFTWATTPPHTAARMSQRYLFSM